MIVDVFPFYNELELLEYRLETLYPVVDKFVLVESTMTYRGYPKELIYEKNKNKFIKFSDKIIHVIDDEMVPNAPNPWVNEKHQRDYAAKNVVMKMGLADGDIIISCDVDEIPDPEMVKKLPDLLTHPLMALKMDMYYYTLEYKLNVDWTQPTALYFFALQQLQSLTEARHFPDKKVIYNAGWHLSYFGDPQFIINKLKNFAHSEFADAADIPEDVIEAVRNRESICDKSKLVYIPLSENTRLPPNHQLLKTKAVTTV